MKKLIILFFPIFLFSQNTTLIGDVDCSGDVTSEDASLILQFVTSVIEELPCQENMNGLTPDQLEEMVQTVNEQVNINYSSIGFGDWVLKYDNPSSDVIYGQEETDGFLLIEYSRENEVNSSASFGFNIHLGSEIDTINFVMDNSIVIKTSWNPKNTKLLPIKKGDYWVVELVDDYSTEVSIDQIHFLPINSQINMTQSGIEQSINENNFNQNMMFPDGNGGEPISWSCINNGSYIVPEGKNLYITQYYSSSDLDLTIDNILLSSSYSNNIVYTGVGFSPSLTNGMPFIIGSGQEVNGGNFNGFLKDAIVNPVSISTSNETYIVPEGKTLYIMQYYGDSSSELFIDDVLLSENYSNNIYYTGVGFTPQMTFSMPLIVGEGQLVSGGGNFNGYLIDSNSFSSNQTNESISNDNFILLNSDQYYFSSSFDGTFYITAQVQDSTILNSYLIKGITCNIYDNEGALLNSSGVFNHPATSTTWNLGSSILEQQGGEIINVHITFMSSLGMIVIDETLSIPE